MPLFTEDHPGVASRVPPEAAGFTFNHTMLRVKDPEKALAFYTEIFGMRLLRKLDFPEMQFTLFYLARLEEEDRVPEDAGERTVWTLSRQGVLELTHNWGTEDQADFRYHDGNAQPQGFGHICFSVPDLITATDWFDKRGVEYVKRADEGKMKNVVFIKDPDGYWIEIVEAALMADTGQ
ncbi:lactoylglutathione lyase [Halomonas shantousis]